MRADRHAPPGVSGMPSIADLRLRLNLAGFELREVQGAFVISKWGLLRVLPDLQAVIRFCKDAGVPA